MLQKFSIIFFLLLLSNKSVAQLTGNIQMVSKDNFYTFYAQIENGDALFKDNLDYNFVALKKSETNNYSTNKQAGKFSLQPFEKITLSELNINLNKNDEIKVFLFIRKEDKLLSKDSIFIQPNIVVKEKEEKISESDFVLKGVVIETMITKMGKDFYDFFYQSYQLSGTKYPFIIYLKEKPSFGRSSIISIEVDDRKIFEFNTRPNEEYLKSAVQFTLNRINEYSKRRKMLFSNKRI